MRWSDVRRRLLTDPQVRAEYENQSPFHRLGAAVAVRRTALQLSQAELAKQAGVTQRQISALENGKANLTVRTLTRIASALGVELQLGIPHSVFASGLQAAKLTRVTAIEVSTAGVAPWAVSVTSPGLTTTQVPPVQWDSQPLPGLTLVGGKRGQAA